MPVHQIEEYFLIMQPLTLTEESKAAIEEHLSDEGYSTYDFQDDGTTLVVDDIPDESSGETLEAEIEELLG